MHTRYSLNLLAVLVLVILSACSAGPSPTSSSSPVTAPTQAPASQPAVPPTSQPVPPTAAPLPTPTRAPLPPTVVSVTPDRGEEAILAAPVVVTFDQPMDPATTGAAFAIEPKTAGQVKVQGNALSFTPAKPFKRGTEYRVTLAESAASTAGLRLQQPISFKFATAGFLEVTNTQPADGAENVSVDSTITVAFNRPVVPLVGTRDLASLPQPLTITPTLTGTGEWINTSIYRFTPAQGLAASTVYTVTVEASLEDTTGGILEKPYTFGFSTSDPTVVRWQPENSTSVRIEQPISVTFSMPMDRASTEAAFSLVDEAKKPVAGSFNWNKDGTELGFKPTQLLKFGAKYEAGVELTARSANGQGTLRDNRRQQFPFLTVPLPSVKRTDPAQGLKSVDPSGGVRFEFAGPMAPGSFGKEAITVLPKPTQVYTYYNESENYLYLDFYKAPDTDYSVTLAGKVADPYGNTLGEDYVLRFRTRGLDPILQLNNQTLVGTYNAYTGTQAVVLYRNLPEVRFDLFSVTPDEFLTLTGGEFWQKWENFQPKQENRIRAWTRPGKAARNRVGYMREPLLTADEKPLPAGVYYLETDGDLPRGERPPRQLLVRSDLNVTLKASTDEALAWVTDLKTGQPVSGAQVRFADNGANDVKAVTGADGIAKVKLTSPRRTWEPLVAFATTEAGGFGVASTSWQDGISPWDFGTQGAAEADPYIGYVYTDRPIYRPDQTVYWKAIFRRDNDAQFALPAPGQPVTVTIRDDQGNQLLEQKLKLNPVGAVDGKLALGPEAALGYYYISLQFDKERSYGVGFQVAEYRKPEYEISAATDQPEYVQGEQINVAVQANYFFGGPVQNGKVRWTQMSTDAPFSYQGEGYWSFEDYDWYEPMRGSQFGGQISQGEGKTDAQGRFTFSVPADIGKFQRSQRFTFDITVQDVNNQAVSTQASAVVHKGDYYIGLSPRSYVVTQGEPAQVDVITVDAQSQPVPDTKVDLVVSQIEWMSVREKAADGNSYWVSRPKKTPVVTETLTTDAKGAAVLNWTPKAPGEYKIEATGRDRVGHAIRSAAYTWVSGPNYVPWRTDNNDRIKLVADKSEYVVGDTAEILVPSPYQGKVKALLTTERGQVLSSKVIELAGNSEVIKLPITAEDAPNMFVSLVLMKGMDKTTPLGSFKVGLTPIKVSVADKELQVILTPHRGEVASPTTAASTAGGVTPPLQVAPRDTVTWDVLTLDAAGKPVPADVSLALVDKAVLTLADDNAGKLMDRFYYQRGLGVQTGATWVLNVDRLVAQLAEGGKGGGGGGGGPEMASVRREFPDSAFWRANVTTGADGKAQVQVTLPDNLTTWTMDARAATEDTRVGQSKADIIATKDLVVRPVLPRFFVDGDRAEIAAVVHNNTEAEVEVEVKLAAEGLEISADTASRITVPAGGTYKAVWPVTVTPGAGEVKVLMSAKTVAAIPPLADAVEITLPVLRYTTPEVVGTSGQVALNEERLELVRVPANADPTQGELDVRLEPSLAAGTLGGLTYLEHYPYECTEQTMSRFLPNVVTYAALKELGVGRPDLDAKLPQQVGVGLQRIYAQQHVDGGWGWWQSDDSRVAVSSYVVFALAKAKQAGFTVDQTVLDRGVRYLTESLNSAEGSRTLAAQRAGVHPLRAGRGRADGAEPGRRAVRGARRAEHLRQSVPGAGAQPDQRQSRGGAHQDAAGRHQRAGDHQRHGDALGRGVDGLLEHEHRHPHDVHRARHAGQTRSREQPGPQHRALADGRAQGRPLGNHPGERLGHHGADRLDGRHGRARRKLRLARDAERCGDGRGHRDAEDGGGGHHAARRHRGAAAGSDQRRGHRPHRRGRPDRQGTALLHDTPQDLPARRGGRAAQPRGDHPPRISPCRLRANRPIRGLRAGPKQTCPTVTQAKVGDVLDVKLTVVVPNSLYYVVVEDPLPAGAEALDASLKTTSKTIEGPQIEEENEGYDPWADWRWQPTHVELRDEKAVLFQTALDPGTYEFSYQIRASLPGEYLTLPPTASQMYFPEVWGRGAGSTFTVTE